MMRPMCCKAFFRPSVSNLSNNYSNVIMGCSPARLERDLRDRPLDERDPANLDLNDVPPWMDPGRGGSQRTIMEHLYGDVPVVSRDDAAYRFRHMPFTYVNLSRLKAMYEAGQAIEVGVR